MSSADHFATGARWIGRARFIWSLARKLGTLKTLLVPIAFNRQLSQVQQSADSREIDLHYALVAQRICAALDREIEGLSQLYKCSWIKSSRGAMPAGVALATRLLEEGSPDPGSGVELDSLHIALGAEPLLKPADFPHINQMIRVAILMRLTDYCVEAILKPGSRDARMSAHYLRLLAQLDYYDSSAPFIRANNAEQFSVTDPSDSFSKLTETPGHGNPTRSYASATLVTLLVSAVSALATIFLAHSLRLSWVAVPAAFLGSWELVTVFLRWLAIRRKSERIPRALAFEEGAIPLTSRTAICVPLVLGDADRLRRMVESFVHTWKYHREPNVGVVLLTDWAESENCEPSADDEAQLRDAIGLVEELNEGDSAFAGRMFLFHRPRSYSRTQGTWYGWERKRGKICQFSQMIVRGAEPFSVKIGDLNWLRACRFIIVADEDVSFSPQSARSLIGLASHPSSKPHTDTSGLRVVDGYGAFAPVVYVETGDTTVRRAAHSLVGPPYPGEDANSVPNEWFNAFGERRVPGQGIFEITSLASVAADELPTEIMLSHDTIESGILRAGHAGNVAFVSKAPLDYLAWSERLHRWTRGDCQNLFLIFGMRGTNEAKLQSSRLGKVGLLFVLDAARRSLNPLVFFVLFLFAAPSNLATSIVLAASVAPTIFNLLQLGWLLLKRLLWLSPIPSIGGLAGTLFEHILGALLQILALPHIALVAVDAWVRTLSRAPRRAALMEWVPMSAQERPERRPQRVARYLWMIAVMMPVWLVYEIRIDTYSTLAFCILCGWTVAPWILHRLRFRSEVSRTEASDATSIRTSPH